MMKIYVLVVTAIISGCHADLPADKVLNLPGLGYEPKFKMYSGYLSATGDKKLHYWFVESASNPDTDPVILWLNGGPGCSSLAGFLTEHGPFLINYDGSTVRKNDFSWNNKASVIYLEAPAGVGFSYSRTKNYTTDDDLASLDNFVALKDFFSKFPEFKDNPFFITGESYGGVYAPTLSVRVLADKSINFQASLAHDMTWPIHAVWGFAVGNGLTNYIWNYSSFLYFGYYHGMIPLDQWTRLMLVCCPEPQVGPCNFMGHKSDICMETAWRTYDKIWEYGVNLYNVYDSCLNSDELPRRDEGPYSKGIPFLFKDSGLFKQGSQSAMGSDATGHRLRMSVPCVNYTAFETYLNTPAVRQALHIPDSVQKFKICSSEVHSGYTSVYSDVKQFYATVLAAKKRILVYNGDLDMMCSYLGAQWFVGALGLQKKSPFRAWEYTDPKTGTRQVAGFVESYVNLTFTTIRGAGHSAPTDKPKAAYDMITKYLNNEDF